MKYFISLLISVIIFINVEAQYKEIDEKKEFLGIPFLSTPDYSNLSYFKTVESSIYWNLYTFKNEVPFKTSFYTLSKIYIAVKNVRILDFTIPIENENDFEKIKNDLSASFKDRHENGNSISYLGKNLYFTLSKGNNGMFLDISTYESETIPEPHDNSGIVSLLGKNISDPAITQFIASIPGKNEKHEFENEYEIKWPGEGMFINFRGKGENAILNSVNFYFTKDKSLWKGSPFKGKIKLPYDISETTTKLQLIDMFGKDDDPKGYYATKKYSHFSVEATFEWVGKSNDQLKLSYLTIH